MFTFIMENQNNGYKCEHCQKVYGYRQTLRRHLRKNHGQLINENKGLKCPDKECNKRFPTMEKIRQHITEVHNTPIEWISRKFDSMSDFKIWKKVQEKELKCWYVLNQSEKTLVSKEKIRYYSCFRSGTYVSSGTGKRQPKKIGSRKISGCCPSSMNVTITKNEVRVMFWKTHFGHKDDLIHMLLPFDEMNELGVQTCFEENESQYTKAAIKRRKRSLRTLKRTNKMKIALIQFAVTSVKEDNVKRVCSFIKQAAQNGANLVCLPECFNAPYGVKYFNQYAESIPGYTCQALSESAKENKVYLIGGTFPERDNNKMYNTCLVYGPKGELLAKHRKVHLFDIDIPGKITFKESTALAAGNSLTTFNIGDCKVGLGICYDIRFPIMANIYAQEGCQLLVYPGAFNMTTGPAHWELLQRARALDNQLYVATISPARDENSSYVAWGHSSLISPWGEVISTTDEKEGIIYGDIDLSYVNEVREQIPIRNQQRKDIYEIVRHN